MSSVSVRLVGCGRGLRLSVRRAPPRALARELVGTRVVSVPPVGDFYFSSARSLNLNSEVKLGGGPTTQSRDAAAGLSASAASLARGLGLGGALREWRKANPSPGARSWGGGRGGEASPGSATPATPPRAPQELPLHPTASRLPAVVGRGARPRQPAGHDWEAAPHRRTVSLLAALCRYVARRFVDVTT